MRPQSLAFAVGGSAVAASCTYAADGATCELAEPLTEGEVELMATVEDELGNVSRPAAVHFRVASSDDDGGSEDIEDPPDGSAPTYTPVVSPRGRRPNTTFVSASDVETVDTASGSLTLSVPLGQVYEVGPMLRYQLRAVYNSRVWEHMQLNCDLVDGRHCGAGDYPVRFALTNPNNNAGLGWEVHLGKLYSPDRPAGMTLFEWQRWPNCDFGGAQLDVRGAGRNGALSLSAERPRRRHRRPAGALLEGRQLPAPAAHRRQPGAGRAPGRATSSRGRAASGIGGARRRFWLRRSMAISPRRFITTASTRGLGHRAPRRRSTSGRSPTSGCR